MRKKLACFLSVIMIGTLVMTGSVFADDDPKPTNITKLNYTKRTVKTGAKFKIKAYATPTDFDDDSLVWSIGKSSIVTFDDKDHTDDDMEFLAKKPGTTKVTCTIKGTTISKSCTVTVKSYGKAKIKVDDTHMDVDKGEWDDIEARLVGGTYKNRKLSYTVQNKRIAKVKKGKVYGKRVGKTKITIRAKANRKIKKTVYVRVERDD